MDVEGERVTLTPEDTAAPAAPAARPASSGSRGGLAALPAAPHQLVVQPVGLGLRVAVRRGADPAPAAADGAAVRLEVLSGIEQLQIQVLCAITGHVHILRMLRTA